MTLLPAAMAPLPPERAPHLSHDREVQALLLLARAGLPVAPFRILSARAEDYFYYLNNLPEQLGALLKAIDLSEPDEDELEKLCQAAQALLLGHYLLDESIDLFYDAIAPLPPRLRLRRPNSDHTEYARRGRSALLAVKRLWGREWTFEAVVERLATSRRLAPDAREVLILAAGSERADDDLTARVHRYLGESVDVWLEPGYGIARLDFSTAEPGPLPPVG
jgi:hypothetical protein